MEEYSLFNDNHSQTDDFKNFSEFKSSVFHKINFCESGKYS